MSKILKIKIKIKEKLDKYKYLKSDSFNQLKENTNNKRIILIDTPTHGNLGDQAIALSENSFLSTECNKYKIIELTQEQYLYSHKKINKYIKPDDTIIIHGGGFIGTLWPNEEKILLQLLKQFSLNKIIIFPQTAYFETTPYGHEQKVLFINVVNSCKDLTIFLRDKNSYIYMKSIISNEKIKLLLVPDIVTYNNQFDFGLQRQNHILFCLRTDVEKTVNSKMLENIFNTLKQENIDTLFTDTIYEGNVPVLKRTEYVEQKLKEFAKAKLVITDRLHGMLFCAVTGTPCIAMDNVSQKVSGTYEWINYLDYIECIPENELTIEKIKLFLKINNTAYTNKPLEKYYKQIREAVVT